MRNLNPHGWGTEIGPTGKKNDASKGTVRDGSGRDGTGRGVTGGDGAASTGIPHQLISSCDAVLDGTGGVVWMVGMVGMVLREVKELSFL